MSRGKRALQLHSVEEWQEIVAKLEATVKRTAEYGGAGAGLHRDAVYELRRAEQWRDEAVEEHQRAHRYDGMDDRDVARIVADKVRDY